MRFYISTRGDAQGIERAKALSKILEERGHINTFKWWEAVEKERAKGNVDDGMLSPSERRWHAMQDFSGVRTSDLALYLEPHEKSEGAAWELGGAWMLRSVFGLPFVIAVGPRRSFIFSELSDERFEKDEEIPDQLQRLAREVEARRQADGRR